MGSSLIKDNIHTCICIFLSMMLLVEEHNFCSSTQYPGRFMFSKAYQKYNIVNGILAFGIKMSVSMCNDVCVCLSISLKLDLFSILNTEHPYTWFASFTFIYLFNVLHVCTYTYICICHQTLILVILIYILILKCNFISNINDLSH